MEWQILAEEQSSIIESLSELCRQLINTLAQYKNIEAEEKRLSEITQEGRL